MGDDFSFAGWTILHSAIFLLHFFDGADGETRTLVGRGARQFTKLLLSLLSHVGLKGELKVAGCRVAGRATSSDEETCNLQPEHLQR